MSDHLVHGVDTMYNDAVSVGFLEETYDEQYEPTEKEVHEQCVVLGIDPVAEPEFVYIAKEALKAPLPSNWKPIVTQNDDIFYFDSNTGVSTWMHPCDVYYENLLRIERKKKAASATTAHSDGGHILGHYGTAPPLYMSSGGSLAGQKQVPDLPPPLQSIKPPIFGTSGISQSTTLGSLGPLPSIKPLTEETKKPLPSLKTAPPLGQPTAVLNQPKPPLKTLNNNDLHRMPKSGSGVAHIGSDYDINSAIARLGGNSTPIVTNVLKPPLSTHPVTTMATGSDDGIKSAIARLGGDSTPIVANSLEPAPPSTHPVTTMATKSPTDLDKMLRLSNHYEEENQTADSTTDNDTDSLAMKEESSFGQKYNLMGMEDLVTPCTDTVNKDDPIAKENEEKTNNRDQKLAHSQVPLSSYFMKSSNPLPDMSSPSHTPMGSPRPGAARGRRTQTALTSSLAKEGGHQIQGVANSFHSSSSSSDSIISMGQVQGDLVKKHQQMLERIKQDYSKECETLRLQFQQETMLEKAHLEDEKSRKISLIKEQFDDEIAKERTKLETEHYEKKAAMRKAVKEEEDDEEARLQERKEDTLRDIRKKFNKEQQNEEEQLKNAKDKAIADLQRDLEETRFKMEKELKETMNETVSKLKTAIEQETELELAKLRADKSRELETLKKEFKNNLEKEKSDLMAKNQEELVNLKASLSKEHDRLLEDYHNETLREITKKKDELEEQRLLESAVEEEIGKSLETRKKDLEDKYKEEMAQITKTHEENLANMKQKYKQEFEIVQAEWEQKITNLKMEKNEELTRQREEYEQARIDLDNKMSDLVKKKEKYKKDLQEFNTERDLFCSKKEDMQRTLKELEKQIEERQVALSSTESGRNPKKDKEGTQGTLTTAEEHFPRLNIKRDELLKEIGKLEAERELLIKNVELLQTEVHGLVHVKSHPPATPHSSIHSSRSTPQPLHHHTSPLGYTLTINPISDNLIFQNPATTSTSLLDEAGGGVSVTTATVKSDIGMTSLSSSDNNLESMPSDIHQVHSLHLSDLRRPSNHKASSSVRPHHARPEAPHIPFTVDTPKHDRELTDMWTKVRNRIEQEGQALLKLEQDFARGPVKRLQKIEQMLEDMSEKGKEHVIDSDAGFSDNHHHHNQTIKRPHSTPNRNHYHDPVAVTSHSHTKLAIEDLESTSSCSSSDSPQTQEIINQSRQHRKRHNPKQPSRDSDKVFTTLDRISGQLDQVLDRLNDGGEQGATTVESSSDRTQYKRREFDRELHDKWQKYMDQAAKDDSLRQAAMANQHRSAAVFDPPVGKTKTDIAGETLIQRQKDWLKEFKQSVPPLRGKYQHH